MAGPLDFAGMVPGFDFLQGLMKGAGSALPPMGQWVAPTLDPDELDKRIQELRTVQFWLEQNTKLLGTTIQALEVQRMTLATLKTMNMPMTDLRDALSIKTPAPPPAVTPATAQQAAQPQPDAPAQAAAAPAVDPVKWWGALTEQFSHIAAKAMQAAPGVTPAAVAAPAAAKAAAAPRKTAARRAAPAAKRARSTPR